MPPGTGVTSQSYRRSLPNSVSSVSCTSRLRCFEYPPLLSIAIPSHPFQSEPRARAGRAPRFGTSCRGNVHKTQVFACASARSWHNRYPWRAVGKSIDVERLEEEMRGGEPANGRGVVLRMCRARRWALRTVESAGPAG